MTNWHNDNAGSPLPYANPEWPVIDRARKKVEAILASPQQNPLPDAAIGKLEDILRRADRELTEAEKNG